MAYNADGHLLEPIVIHKGEILRRVSDHFHPRIVCIGTRDGELNFNVIGCVLQRIHA